MRVGELVAGRYRLDEQIGAGGMGVVWRATDQVLHRTVSLKRTKEPGATEQARRRADREARAVARLHHPHIVTLHDIVTDAEDMRWLVMEYVASRSLADILRERGRLAPADVARVGAQIAGALQAVHAQGILHRDVKPGNILVTDEGVAKLTDFGISRPLWDDATATESGWIGGTPAYLAPEVASGNDPTAASDVFGLGATVYTAVEGNGPFGDGDNPLQTVHRAAAGQIPPPQHAGPLGSVLTALLDPDPARRPTAADARTLLRGIAGGGTGDTDDDEDSVPLPPRRRMPRRRTVIVAAAAVAVVAVGASVLAVLADRESGVPSADTGRQASPAVAKLGDPHTADPCGLLADAPLRKYGDTTWERNYGNFDRCDIIVEAPGQDEEIDVSVELDQVDAEDLAAGRKEKVGGLTVVSEPEDDDSCDRVIVLGDRTSAQVIVKQYDKTSPKLCEIADVATDTAVGVLKKGTVPRKPAPGASSLASLDACKLLDDDALAVIPGVNADEPDAGFGNWSCDWQSTTSDTSLSLRFDQTPTLTADDGFPKKFSGRKAFIEPDGDGDGTCLSQLAFRPFRDDNGVDKDELVYLVVSGDRPKNELCMMATSLTRSMAADLPPPS